MKKINLFPYPVKSGVVLEYRQVGRIKGKYYKQNCKQYYQSQRNIVDKARQFIKRHYLVAYQLRDSYCYGKSSNIDCQYRIPGYRRIGIKDHSYEYWDYINSHCFGNEEIACPPSDEQVFDNSPDTHRPEAQFEMFPDAFVNGRKRADKTQITRKLKQEVPQGTEEDYKNDTP